MQEESVSQVSSISDLLSKFLVNLPNLNNSEELEKTSRRVFNDFSIKHPKLIFMKLVDLLSYNDILENLSSFNFYLQFFNEACAINLNEKWKLPINLEEGLLNFLKATIMNTIKYTEIPNLSQTITNLIFERKSGLIVTAINLMKMIPNKTIDNIIILIDPLIPLDPFLIQILVQISNSQALMIFTKINDIVSRIMPTLALIKQESLRVEYCTLITALCDTLILSLENQKSFNFESVSQLMTTFFEVIYNQWWNISKESKTKAACLNAMGYLSHFLSNEKIKNLIEPLTQSYISTFKKDSKSDLMKILEGFNTLLEKLFMVDKYLLETLVKSLVVSMHSLFISPIFSSNFKFDPVILKYKNELLKSIYLLGKFNADVIFDHFLGRMTCKEKLEKICSMWILILLISRENKNISENLKKMLLSHLQNLVYETDFEVRFVICELTLTMIQTSCYKVSEDIQFLVFFLLKQVAIHDDEIKEKKYVKSDPFETTIGSLRSRSQQILLILSNDLTAINNYFWPYILEFVINSAFSPGLSYLLKTISTMIKKVMESAYKIPYIDYSKNTNTPKTQSIILRLIILLYKPHIFQNLGKEILASLPLILPVMDNVFCDENCMKQLEIVKMEGFLKNFEEQNSQYFDAVDELWLRIITLKSNDREWLSDMNEILLNSYKLYCNNIEFVSSLCRMNGILLSRSDRVEQVKYGLEKLFTLAHPEYSNNILNLSNPPVDPPQNLRFSVAEAFGYVSISHFDIVIEKIRQIFNSEIIGKKQSTGITSFFMKSASPDEAAVGTKITLVLSLGYIAKHTNPAVLINKIEVSIINNILPFMEKPVNYQLKTACQKAVLMVSNSLEKIFLDSSVRIDEQFKIFILKQREKLLEKTLTNYNSEKINDLKLFSMNTMSSLLRIDPAHECEKYQWLVNEACELLWENKDKEGVKESFSDVLSTIFFHEKLFFAPKEGLEIASMNYWEFFLWTLLKIQQKLDITNEKKSLAFLLVVFEELANNLEKKQKSLQFSLKSERKIGFKILLCLMSYVYFEIVEIRISIVKCIKVILNVFCDNQCEELSFDNYQNFNTHVVKYFADKLSTEEIYYFLEELIETLKNKNWSIFQGLGNFLSILLEFHEKMLQNSYNRIVNNLLKLYENIDLSKEEVNPEKKLEEISEIVKKLLTNNLTEIIEIFLESKPQIPLNGCISNSLIKISSTKSQVLKSFNHLTDVLNNPEHIISEDVGAKVMNAALFIGVIMEQKDEIVVSLSKKYFPQIFSTFLIRISTSYDDKWTSKNRGSKAEDDPCKQTLWSLKKFLECAGDKYILGAFESGVNTKFLSDSYDEGIIELILLYCKHSTLEDIKSIYDFLLPFLSKKIESQKLVAIIFVAQFISSVVTLKNASLTLENMGALYEWINNLIDILLINIYDKASLIRKHCLKGLGHISLLLKFNFKSLMASENQTENYSEEALSFEIDLEKTQSILDGLFHGMEDSSEFCTREALFGLQRLIHLLDSRMVRPNLLNILTRLPDNFERSDALTRMGAFNLLGKLAVLINEENEHYDQIIESVHFQLISLILHINDENQAVKQACINSLNNVANILMLNDLKILIDSLSEESEKNKFSSAIFDKNEVFLLKSVEILAQSYPERLMKYIASLYGFCSSPDDNIKGIAGLLMCQCLVCEKSENTNENIIHKLCSLMDEKSQIVKNKVIKGLHLLSPMIKS